MQIGESGLNLIKSFEGCHLNAYKPVKTEKYWTIGWGHYGPDVDPGMEITQQEADDMLTTDLERYVDYVNNPNFVTITYELNQHQFDALVSFCYNCGSGSLKEACKGKRTPDDIADEITKYNKAGGKVLPGLVRRRYAEVELFFQKGLLDVWAFEFIEAVMKDYWEQMKGNDEVQSATHLAMEELRSDKASDWAFEFIEAVMKNYWGQMDGNPAVQNATHEALEELRRATGRKEEE